MAYPRYGTRSAPQRVPRRGWLGLAVAILAIVGMLALIVSMLGLIGDFVNGRPRGAGERDPMFAEAPETITRPPSLMGEDGSAADEAEDRSQSWHYETLTPLTPGGLAAS